MAARKTGAAVWLVAITAAAMTQTTLIPSIPASQEDSSLSNLWRYALRNQKSPGGQVLRNEDPAPKTFVSPEYIEVINWVPQDSAHPLYDTGHADLLREILLDYMVQEAVLPDDPRMSQPNGLQMTNLNGKSLTFTRDAKGIKLDGVPVTDSRINKDGTVSYVVYESLFGHRQMVHDAWEKYIKTVPAYDPFGRPLGFEDPPPLPPPST